MWSRQRMPVVIAGALLALMLLSPIPDTTPNTSVTNPGATAPVHREPRAAPAAPAPAAVPAEPQGFGLPDVERLAKERAAHEFHPPSDALPGPLANLSYDQYRDIRYRPGSALWRGQAMFEVQFFHRGYHNKQRVNVYEVSEGGVNPVKYSPAYFMFGRLLKTPRISTDIGFAGFRVHYPLQTPAYKDELIAFFGASYFRVLGRGEHYGLSGRGLAIDTAEQSGEEFPTFTDFWLVKPRPNERTLTVYALLDSKSVAGAYEFRIRPGATTQVEVHCQIYPRRALTKVGIAPLTSMYFYGEDGIGRRFDDYRPQVHDSDGLMMETGNGEWIWRPLSNPRDLRVNRFMDNNPRGFGLIQRERSFAHYEDPEALYQTRPSYWVEPLGQWGKGGVELVEIPSDQEIHDNIVAYWVSSQPVAAGRPVSYAYVISAYSDSSRWPPGGRVVATRSGNPAMGDNPGHYGAGARRVLVDFAGGDLDGLEASQPVRAELKADNARVDALSVQRIPESGVWRATFIVTPRGKKPVDMRCYLTLYGDALTETWVYQWTP